MICIHCEHKFIGNAFVRGSGRVWVAMRRCPKCNKEFVAPPRPRAPGKIVTLASENDALRAQLDDARAELVRWTAWGTAEVAIRNSNVASSMEHWETRALSAEAERDALRDAVEAQIVTMSEHIDAMANRDFCCINALGAASARAWSSRNTQCGCDRGESCAECFPPAFHKDGYWEQQRSSLQQSDALPEGK